MGERILIISLFRHMECFFFLLIGFSSKSVFNTHTLFVAFFDNEIWKRTWTSSYSTFVFKTSNPLSTSSPANKPLL